MLQTVVWPAHRAGSYQCTYMLKIGIYFAVSSRMSYGTPTFMVCLMCTGTLHICIVYTFIVNMWNSTSKS